jgi:hypothetical protein
MPAEEMVASRPPPDHVTVRPVMTLPCASLATADACDVPPTRMLLDERLTDTEATVATVDVTLTDMLPVTPEAAARIVAAPAPVAETRPLPDTVATAGFDVVHVK